MPKRYQKKKATGRRSKFENGDGFMIGGHVILARVREGKWEDTMESQRPEYIRRKKDEKNDDASLFRLRRGVVLVICIVLYICI